jgi:hypothetical protein
VRNPDAPPLTRGVVLRIFVLVVAVVLAGVAAWLIVTNDTAKRVQLGVLAGLWSALLAGFALYGARRSIHPDAEPIREQGAELELRSMRTELERAEEAAARRAHEARLEQLLRAEVQAAIAREVTSLRAEIAELRGELLEKVGNQVRLERIETTRVIGSDLEALQHEVRQQLQAVAREVGDIGTLRSQPAEPPTLRPIVEPARVRPVSREAAEVQAEVQPATSDQPTERVVEPEPPRPTPTVDWNAATPEPPRSSTPPAEITGPVQTEQPRPTPEPPRPSPAPAPEREAIVLPLDSRVDTLSGLPRIEPFTEFELDPIEDEESVSYTGRRRRGEEDEGAGRHSRSDGPGRRRRNEDDENDLLARLLARETH